MTKLDLSPFTGTEQWYQHFTGLLYTDGVKYVADTAGAYWLIDAIASYQHEPQVKRNRRLQEFQLWVLEVDPAKKTGRLSLFEDSGCPPVLIRTWNSPIFPKRRSSSMWRTACCCCPANSDLRGPGFRGRPPRSQGPSPGGGYWPRRACRVRANQETVMSLMQQYHAAKARHPNMLLLFRMGDFYELFGADAEAAAKILGLALTRRDETPMAGFPHQALEHHLRRLLQAGQRVAICDQMQELPAGQPAERIILPGAESASVHQPTLFDEEV